MITVAFSPDGKYLTTNSDDRAVRVWDIAAGREVTRLPHKYGVRAVALNPSDGKYPAIASIDEEAQLVESLTGRQAGPLRGVGSAAAVTFTRDGKYFATAGA